MIDVLINFNKISFDNDLLKVYNEDKYSHIPKTIKSALLLYLCKMLNIPGVFGLDAFSDNLWPLRFKEWTEYREKDEWNSYEEYLKEKENNSQYGLKNEHGVRDDLKLVFVNFQPFLLKYRSVACELLEVLFDSIEETKEYSTDDGDDILKMDIYIKS